MQWIREKFGTVVISAIIGLIAFVFVFFGVFNPKSTRGLHEGAVAGTVNGDSITIADYNRELNRRLEFFKNLAGGKVSEEQLKAFRIREAVFQDLVRRKLLVQEAKNQGMTASDEEVRDTIARMPAFQKDGKFDVLTYKQVLQANQYSPSNFEKLVREDLSTQSWDRYFQRRVNVSDEEAKTLFIEQAERRNIKYVLVTPEAGRKGISISQEDVKKFLAEPARLNLAKSRYEAGKETLYQGKSFEDVKDSIARDTLASEKSDEVRKITQKLAEDVQPHLTAGKADDGKVNALLKAYGVEVKTTGLIGKNTPFLPGVGDIKPLLQDAFVEKSSIDAAQGGKAKIYSIPAGTLVALVIESQKPDLAKFDGEREQLLKQVAMRKTQALSETWMKGLMDKAKIDPNPSVISPEG